MAEPDRYTFTYKEVAEALIKQQDIHEGRWALWLGFSLQGANWGPTDDNLSPGALLSITQVGLQKADRDTNISVDAKAVNPRKPKKASTQK